LEVDRRRCDLERDQGRRLPGDGEGTHQLLDLPAGPQHRVRDGGSRFDSRSQGGAGYAEAEARERALSDEGWRQDLGEDERLRHTAVLLLAGESPSEEPRSRVVLVD